MLFVDKTRRVGRFFFRVAYIIITFDFFKIGLAYKLKGSWLLYLNVYRYGEVITASPCFI